MGQDRDFGPVSFCPRAAQTPTARVPWASAVWARSSAAICLWSAGPAVSRSIPSLCSRVPTRWVHRAVSRARTRSPCIAALQAPPVTSSLAWLRQRSSARSAVDTGRAPPLSRILHARLTASASIKPRWLWTRSPIHYSALPLPR
jgi:hypothetical protein